MRVANSAQFYLNSFCREVNNLHNKPHDKTDSDKITHNSLDEKLKDQNRALHSLFFTILHHKSTVWKTYDFQAIFSASIYVQNRKGRHKIFFSEPEALFMKFATRDDTGLEFAAFWVANTGYSNM